MLPAIGSLTLCFPDTAALSGAALADRILDRPLPSVGDDPAARREAHDSDHAPVAVQLSTL
jgi:hypothetical protein